GTLDISVDGYTAGTEHDVLGVGGVATLAGTLDVTTLGSFTPTPASTVQFLTASSFAGAFGTANLPTLSGSNSFVRQQNATNETLVTVAVADCAMPEVLQWANSVIGFSSEWSTHWFGSVQMLGAPNVSVYGVNKYGWTASAQNGSVEHVTLGFATPVFASGVTIREHNGNGFVTQVDVVDMDDVLHTVWTGSDPSAQSAGIVNFLVEWAQTSYLVKGVRVYVDMDTTADWEQIDAVQLRGSQGPISQWADHVLGFSSHWSASSFSADQ
ncbi:MAG: hypothetical protein GY716_14210, partial [bacterium]|nr:hypothetical protein [bacterium]